MFNTVMLDKKEVIQKEISNYAKFFDFNNAYLLLKKLRRETRNKPVIMAGLSGLIINALGNLLSALKNPATPSQLKTMIVGSIGYLLLPASLKPIMITSAGFTNNLANISKVVQSVNKYSNFKIEKLDAEIDAEN